MNYNKRKPLGYIKLESGLRAIMPMNDFFLSYLFNQKENWETLRKIYNIFVLACKDSFQGKADSLELIIDQIKVESQYEYLLDTTRNKKQDAVIIEGNKNLTFIEFQNRSRSAPSIEIRGIEYLALSISKTKNQQIANQVWILGQHHKRLLEESAFEYYTITSKLTGKAYPNKSSMFYISLEKLILLDTQAGQLSRFLLGIDLEPTDECVKKIATNFAKTFKIVQEDKEVRDKMTFLEYYKAEGIAEGIEQGIEQGSIKKAIQMARKLLLKNFSFEEIAELTELDVDTIRELKTKI